MSRLDKARQEKLEPKRMVYAEEKLSEVFTEIKVSTKEIQFFYDGHWCSFFPYSGWATGKTIEDGRGLDNLLKQIK